ncbi:head maturation protease, ClpP-related [Niallia sp. 03190]|uniref:head maturation protease, ClpP-related n=1 Tax=Niallia sp. 03190 TaxID=3458061 RepID=UPI00404395FC
MGKFWTMNKSETKKNSAEIFIYGSIGSSWWEESVSASQFGRDLKALGDDIEDITVRINSTGGSVYDGLAIRSLLKNHAAKVTAIVDGLAASIASIIAMGADVIIMAKGSNMMIHNPLASAFGEAKDLRDMADFLDMIRDSLVTVYEAKTGKTKDELIDLLDAETWMSADEAVEMGFADEVEDQMEVTASMAGTIAIFNGVSMDVSKFTNIPDRLLAMAPPSIKIKPNNNSAKNQTEEDEQLDLNKLKNDYPDLYQQIVNEAKNQGVEAERNRFKAIDEIAMPGYEEIINKAKYETGDSAELVAMQMIRQDKALAGNHLTQTQADAQNLTEVGGAQAPQNTETDKEKEKNMASGLAALINKKRGLVK